MFTPYESGPGLGSASRRSRATGRKTGRRGRVTSPSAGEVRTRAVRPAREPDQCPAAQRGDAGIANGGAEPAIEALRAGIAAPAAPPQTRETPRECCLRHRGHQRPADPPAAPAREHEEVEHPQLRGGDVGVVAADDRGIADDLAVDLGDEDTEARTPTE